MISQRGEGVGVRYLLNTVYCLFALHARKQLQGSITIFWFNGVTWSTWSFFAVSKEFCVNICQESFFFNFREQLNNAFPTPDKSVNETGIANVLACPLRDSYVPESRFSLTDNSFPFEFWIPFVSSSISHYSGASVTRRLWRHLCDTLTIVFSFRQMWPFLLTLMFLSALHVCCVSVGFFLFDVLCFSLTAYWLYQQIQFWCTMFPRSEGHKVVRMFQCFWSEGIRKVFFSKFKISFVTGRC